MPENPYKSPALGRNEQKASRVRTRIGRRLPLISVGLAFIAASAAPIAYAQIHAFNQLAQGQDVRDVSGAVKLAFHPAFMAAGTIGLLLAIAGVVRVVARKIRK